MAKTSKKKILTYALIVLIIMLLIFFFSAQNGDDSQDLSDGFLKWLGDIIALLPDITGKGEEYDIRKYAHITEYLFLGVFTALLYREIFLNKKRPFLFAPLAAFGHCFIYALSDEFHQYFIPGRAARFTDVMIDSIGFIGGIGIILIVWLIVNIKHMKGMAHNEQAS